MGGIVSVFSLGRIANKTAAGYSGSLMLGPSGVLQGKFQ